MKLPRENSGFSILRLQSELADLLTAIIYHFGGARRTTKFKKLPEYFFSKLIQNSREMNIF